VADARPFSQNLPDTCVSGDERDAPVVERELHRLSRHNPKHEHSRDARHEKKPAHHFPNYNAACHAHRLNSSKQTCRRPFKTTQQYGIRVAPARAVETSSWSINVMMTSLEQIYQTNTVTNGQQTYSALNDDGLPTFVERGEGELIRRMIEMISPTRSLEVGFAYGVSTLHICEALSKLPHAAKHIVVDPFQRTKWHGVGLYNVESAGFSHLVDFMEARSEFALPQLLSDGVRLDFALIDSLHTFEQCMIEFFYIDRMLNPNGVLVFDDADWPGINKVIRLALSYGNYLPLDRAGAPPERRSLLGSLRTVLRRLPWAGQVVRKDFLYRAWDLQVAGTCVALQKTALQDRGNGWHRDF
jgi:predicted O-methyltransferase YrrM